MLQDPCVVLDFSEITHWSVDNNSGLFSISFQRESDDEAQDLVLTTDEV